jgi:hypothetical protein
MATETVDGRVGGPSPEPDGHVAHDALGDWGRARLRSDCERGNRYRRAVPARWRHPHPTAGPPAVGIDVEDFSAKDNIYVAFMSFAFWFVTWATLLTAGTSL